jgi:hypothetical protein
MNKMVTIDPCAERDACILPAEFVRLRYFFGQRLGVVDLHDEQSYLVGKQRFHNIRCHGWGVLCGLEAHRYVFPQGSPPSTSTTLLRVHRGAALDPCGREIVVGWDQCIDVAAWYAQHPQAKPQSGTELKLWVALCYRECPSDPAPAPRDPCGCEPGGCEYARIREGFELKLVTEDEAKLLTQEKPPPSIALSPEEVVGSIESALESKVAGVVGAPCPEPPTDPCLLLAAFKATLSADVAKVLDIDKPDNAIAGRRSLLSTAELQQALLAALSGAGGAGLIGDGPKLQMTKFVGNGSTAGTLWIAIVPDEDLSRDPFQAPAQLSVKVSQFDGANWTEVDPDSTGEKYIATSPRHIELTWSSRLADQGRYRVLITSDPAQPPVNQKMQPLAPLIWARQFRLIKDGSGNLSLASSLY